MQDTTTVIRIEELTIGDAVGLSLPEREGYWWRNITLKLVGGGVMKLTVWANQESSLELNQVSYDKSEFGEDWSKGD